MKVAQEIPLDVVGRLPGGKRLLQERTACIRTLKDSEAALVADTSMGTEELEGAISGIAAMRRKLDHVNEAIVVLWKSFGGNDDDESID